MERKEILVADKNYKKFMELEQKHFMKLYMKFH